MAYQKVQAVPNVLFSYQALNSLLMLPEHEMCLVLNAVMEYVDVARQRDTQKRPKIKTKGLTSAGKRICQSMVESVDSGIAGYWKMCEKLAKVRNSNASDDSDESTSSQHVVDINNEVPNDISNELSNEINNELFNENNEKNESNEKNNTPIPLPSAMIYFNLIKGSSKQEEYDAICDVLLSNGINITNFDTEEISKAIITKGLNMQITKECIATCTLDGVSTVKAVLDAFYSLKSKGA